MQIEQDTIQEEKKDNNKMSKLIILFMVLTLLVAIIIIVAIVMLGGKDLRVIVDGREVKFAEDTFKIQEDGTIYISIKDIAPLVGYEAHNGEYKVDIEDKNKMYVEALNETETTSFYRNSKTISKVAPDTNNDYENITIDEAVIMDNDKLYVSSRGFIIGFNSLFSYDSKDNIITIQTLPNLIANYSASINNYGYSALSEDFSCQKALIYGLIVASKESTGRFGVITTEGTEILRPSYTNIKFIESSGEFIITNSSEKVGIAYSTGKNKITVSYDDIQLLDHDRGYYLVKSNGKYGIINSSENFVVHIEYDQIGIDTSQFPMDNIKNQYVLYNNIIPAKLNGMWQLLNIDGNRLTNLEYEDIGYINQDPNNPSVNSALTIDETGTIVVKKDGKYGGVDVKGNDLIPINFEAIYSKTVAGIRTYYILFNEEEYNAVEFIDLMKERLGYEEEQTSVENQSQDFQGSEEQNTVQNEIINDVTNEVNLGNNNEV